MTSYPIDSVVFHGIKSSVGINFSKYFLKDPPTPKNGAKHLVIISTNTIFSFSNIDPNDPSSKTVLNINIQNILDFHLPHSYIFGKITL